jgi:two-component system LytT family sensor kinase
MTQGKQKTDTYKLAWHISIIVIFAVALPVLIVLLSTPDARVMIPMRREPQELVARIIVNATLIPILYFINAYWLIPRFLVARRYLHYAVLLATCAFTVLVVSFFTNKLLYPNEEPQAFLGIVFPIVLLLGLGTSFEMVIQWESQKRNEETMEKEKVTAELSFLKTQINPHFLFNSLNNIYAMAEAGSPKTGQSILLLSNLMRYILYDTRRGRILLAREIIHMEEYIALNRMRIADEARVDISFTKQVEEDTTMIEPLLFIPFVENAFKHGISYSSPSFIHIDLRRQGQDAVCFTIANSKKASSVPVLNETQTKGIGISNTKRRLALLYPGQHTLVIRDEADRYEVQLTLQLKKETS